MFLEEPSGRHEADSSRYIFWRPPRIRWRWTASDGRRKWAIAFLPGRVVVQRALMATKIWSAWTLYRPHSGQGAGNAYSGQGTNVVITSWIQLEVFPVKRLWDEPGTRNSVGMYGGVLLRTGENRPPSSIWHVWSSGPLLLLSLMQNCGWISTSRWLSCGPSEWILW